jgi:hypothetical protein
MNNKSITNLLLLLTSCTFCAAGLYAAVTATGIIRRIDYSQKQSPVGEQQIVFSVQVTQVRFESAGGTCKFYVELKDANGKSYFGSTKVHQSIYRNSAGYPVTYIFPVKINGIPRPSVVAFAAELEIQGVFLNNYKQNVREIPEWVAQCASHETLTFSHVTYQNW